MAMAMPLYKGVSSQSMLRGEGRIRIARTMPGME
jgi:hypothetical protein